MKSKISMIVNRIPDAITNVYCVYLIIVMFLICTVSELINHDLLRDYAIFSFIFFIIAAVIGILLILIICPRFKISKNNKLTKFIVFASIILFILQMFVVYGKFFIAGWDVNWLMLSTNRDDYYFSIYPNNLFLKSLVLFGSNTIKAIPNLTNTFINICYQHFEGSKFLQNLDTQRAADCINYVIFVIINCILVNISVALTSLITNKLKNSGIAKIVYVFTAIFVGLMPWILVPYSDMFAMFFATLILYFYICKNNDTIRWTGIAVATVIGFNIKPTVIFCPIAIILVEICKLVNSNHKSFQINKYIKPTIVAGCAFILCIGLTNVVKDNSGLNTDKNKQFTSYHYLMMGLNPDTLGFWNQEDVDISQNCKNIEERETQNITEINKRINNFGFLGLAKMFSKKSVLNYSDGTFMWGLDGGPNFCTFQIGKNLIANAIYDYYYYPAQILWFMILIGCMLCLYIKKKPKELNVMSMSLIILSIFIMIFECGSRYLILYLPYFIIMSCFGWNNLSGIIQRKFKKNK